MKRLFRVFSVVLGVVAVLMLAYPCYSHRGGGGGHSSGGHAYSGGRGHYGNGYFGHGFYGNRLYSRGYYGYGRSNPFSWGGLGDLGYGGGYPYYGDDGYYPYASDYPYYPSYGGGYPYYGGYPYDYGYYPGKDKYGKPNAQLSELEAQKAERQTSEQEYNDSKEMPVLKQTWVVSGKTALAFNGGVRIVTHKASDKDGCQKDSAAVSYLTSDTDIKKLCLKTGETENFTYQDKNYLFNLSGIAAQANEYRYSISISSER